MSFLCGTTPNLHTKFNRYAFFSKDPSPGRNKDTSRIEKTSLSCGSMTVEAAVVLPLFLFFFINLSSSLDMIMLHSDLQYSLHNAGNELCLYGSLLTEEMKGLGATGHTGAAEGHSDDGAAEGTPSDSVLDVEGIALSYTYVKYRMAGELGEEYLSGSPLRNGSLSLNFLGSSIGEDSDFVDIKLSYAVKTPLDSIGMPVMYMAGRFYGHLWNGYEISGSDESLDQERIVYITADSEVYHITPACTHLKLSVRGLDPADLDNERNGSGGRYYPCTVCAHGDVPDTIYVCSEGDRYHYDFDCYTLTRNYSPVPLSEVEDSHRPCSRCGGG